MSRYEAQAVAALGAIELRPPDAFLWFGRRESVADRTRERLVQRIAERLLHDFFPTGTPRPPRGDPAAATDDGGDFVSALSQANGGRGAWQDGWRIAGPDGGDDDGLRVVRPDGLALFAPAEQVRSEGEAVAVLQPKELRGLRPGVYVALGDGGSPGGDALTGLYWNIAAACAATLVARVTYALNGAGLSFSLELLADPTRYGRGDAAVLVLARADAGAALKLLRPLRRTLAAHLAEAAPAFTRPLARGLAVAEPPAGDTRFGEHRCRLLAEAIVAAGQAAAGERLATVRARFATAGLDLDAPYLQPGSADAYA